MKRILFALLLGASALSFATDGYADPGKGRGHGRGHDDNGVNVVHVRGDDDARVVVIKDDDRHVIRDFIGKHWRDDCPPGLAKKNNGCLPPGQAKKIYHRGDILLVDDDRPRTIWQALADMISPPPSGYRYVRTDRDVLLVNDSNRVVDVVSIDD